MSHKAATAAMLAFLRLYGRAKLVKAGTALTAANPDLQDNFTDALTDIVLLGRSLGLDMDSSIRCMTQHVEPSAVAEDALVTTLAARRGRSVAPWSAFTLPDGAGYGYFDDLGSLVGGYDTMTDAQAGADRDKPRTLNLGNVDEPKVWMIERTGEPWLGDWIAAADVTTYANREEAEAKNRSLGAGGRYWVYGGTAEHNHEGELGYRISSKVSP